MKLLHLLKRDKLLRLIKPIKISQKIRRPKQTSANSNFLGFVNLAPCRGESQKSKFCSKNNSGFTKKRDIKKEKRMLGISVNFLVSYRFSVFLSSIHNFSWRWKIQATLYFIFCWKSWKWGKNAFCFSTHILWILIFLLMWYNFLGLQVTHMDALKPFTV